MIVIYILMIAIMLMPVVILVGQWLYDHRDDIRDIREVRKHARKKDIYLIDYYRIDDVFIRDDHRNWMECRTKWIAQTADENVFKQGYMRAEKWMDDLRYAGVDVYVRLHNFYLTDPSDPATCERIGLAEPNRLTTSIMYNVYHGQTMKRVISGLTRINFAPMDLKSLGVLFPIIIGIAIGMLYFIGGF